MNEYKNVSIIGRPLLICLLTVSFLLIAALSGYAARPEDMVLAMVNNTPIYRSELDGLTLEYLKKAGKQEASDEEKKQLLKNLIRRCLLSQDGRVCALRKDPDIIKKVKALEDELVIARFIDVELASKITISEDELKRYYQKNRNRLTIPDKVKASHILLRTRKEAEDVLRKLRGGQEFGVLVKAYSIDLPMALEGGSMGIIEKGKTLAPLESTLFSLKKNEISDVVETEFGYHVIRVDEIIPGGYKSFDEVKDGIKTVLMKEKESKALTELAARLEETASINIFDAQLQQSSHE